VWDSGSLQLRSNIPRSALCVTLDRPTILVSTDLEIELNSTYFSRSTPSFVWKILFLAQFFYTAS
jgi:hypothetical protein